MKKNSTLFESRKSLLRCCFLSICLLCFGLSSLQAQIGLVKDLNKWGDPYYSEFGNLINVNNTLFFFATGGLYKTDGTTSGTELIYPFTSVEAMINLNGTLILAATDGSSSELWKSDGTTAGTVKLKAIQPIGDFWDKDGSFTIMNNTVYFSASDYGTGAELWKTNGTASGTVLVKDIKAGPTSSYPTGLTAANGKLFFAAPSGNNKGIELWVSDGTTAGTQMVYDIYPGSNSSEPSYLENVNGTVFFSAKNGVNGKELWKSDGTAAGTMMVKDIRSGTNDSQISQIKNVNGVAFFEAQDGVHGKELWKSDGTDAGTMLVKDITPGSSSSAGFATGHITELFSHNGLLYFVCFEKGHRLWKSDGTAAGTIPLTPAGTVEFGFLEPEITVFNNLVYFLAQSNYDYTELWKSDGTVGGTVPVNPRLTYFRYGSYAKLEPVGTSLYMVGSEYNPATEQISGTKLLKSDGTLSGTETIFDLLDVTLGSNPSYLTRVNDKVYFAGDNGEHFSSVLYVTDGTTAGTTEVKKYGGQVFAFFAVNDKMIYGAYDGWGAPVKIYSTDGRSAGTQLMLSGTHPTGIIPESGAMLNGKLLFKSRNQANYDRTLYSTDGTAAGTTLIKDFPSSSFAAESAVIQMNDKVIFSAADASGTELWTSNGTTAGTMLLKDINSGGSGDPRQLVRTTSQVFFTANDGTHGIELWKTDGTAAGTSLTKDITAGNTNTNIEDIVSFNDKVLFNAGVYASSRALWISDGTDAGTFMLRDFYSGNESIDFIEVLNNEAYFVVNLYTNPNHTEIWKTDGTTEGTLKISDIEANVPYTTGAVVYDNIIYFGLTYSGGLWRTDGTTCGTYQIPSDHRMSVDGIALVNSKIIFNGAVNDFDYFSNYGPELYSYTPEAALPCDEAARIATKEEGVLTSDETDAHAVAQYPNPFRNQFSISLAGKDSEKYSVQFINLNGRTIESGNDLSFNTNYNFGAQWSTGIYIMKASVGGKIVTKKLVKTN